MKTLEDRASICLHCLTDTTRSCHNNCTYYERYKAYVEQKAIDDKECESLVGLAVKEARRVFIDKALAVIKTMVEAHFQECDSRYSKYLADTDHETIKDFMEEMKETFISEFEED